MTNEQEMLELAKKCGAMVGVKHILDTPKEGIFFSGDDELSAFAQAVRDQEAAKHAPQWQPIETAPNDYGIDVWIVSLDNPEFGVRMTDVYRIGARWFGIPEYYLTRRVFPTHWMPLPAAPDELYWQCWTAAQDKLRARITELERQLKAAHEQGAKLLETAALRYNELLNLDADLAKERNRAEQAEQRIAESRRQEPVYCGRERLFKEPVVPPTVEEAVSAEAEKWKRILRESCDESRSELMYEQGFICSGAQRAVEESVKAEREACADIASNHECGGEDDIICQGQNCGTCIAVAIRARSTK